MRPNLEDGDVLLVDKNFKTLNRGDIIIFKYPKDQSKLYVKRIVGLPNEKIEFRLGEVFINDVKLEEDYVETKYNQARANVFPLIIRENCYFVLGDNRDNSSDSRSWGMLPKDLITAKFDRILIKSGELK